MAAAAPDALILISNRSSTRNTGYSPCASVAATTWGSLSQAAPTKELQHNAGRTSEAQAGMSWLTLYTYAGICPSHPTTTKSLNMSVFPGLESRRPGLDHPPPVQGPIIRRPIPAHTP